MKHTLRSFSLFALLLFGLNAYAAQVGEIVGKITGPDGLPLEGVTIMAKGDVLPGARNATSNSTGKYRLQLLPRAITK